MAIPNFQKIMLPAIKILGDGSPRTVKEIAISISDHFLLAPEEIKQLLPSGTQTVITNRTN